VKHRTIAALCKETNHCQPCFKISFLYPRYWGIWLAALLLYLLSFVPWFVRSAIAMMFVKMSYLVKSKRRKVATLNLNLCFPELSEAEISALVHKHIFIKIRSALDYGFLWFRSKSRLKRLIEIKNLENYEKHLEAGQSVIFLGCHSLMLDFGATGLTSEYPGVGLIKPVKNLLVDWFVQRGRLRFNAILYSREEGIRPVARAVKRGVFFYYLPDEDREGNESLFSQFFGVEAATLTTLGRLAKICNAKIVPSMTLYNFGKGNYSNYLFPCLEGLPTDSLASDALRLNQEIEKLILLDPAQYMWGMKRFNRRPPGEKDIY